MFRIAACQTLKLCSNAKKSQIIPRQKIGIFYGIQRGKENTGSWVHKSDGLFQTRAFSASPLICDQTKRPDRAFEYVSVGDWTQEDVVAWAKNKLKVGQQTIDSLLKADVTGRTLLSIPNVEYLVNVMKVPPGQAIVLWNDITSTPSAYVEAFFSDCEAIIDQKMKDFKLPDENTAFKLRKDEQERTFSTFYKAPVIFNPLSDKVDIRFMTRKVDDPVYKFFQNTKNLPTDKGIFILRGITGAGKTATILNAIGRAQYVIYTQVDTFESAPADFVDGAMMEFIQNILEKIKEHATKVSDLVLTHLATVYCQLFWMTRLLLLQHMIEHHKISPQQWIYWTNNGGAAVIKDIQQQVLQKADILEQVVLRNMKLTDTIRNVIGDIISKCQQSAAKVDANLATAPIWMAVDEAQIADELLTNHLVSVFDENKVASSLLRVLMAYAPPFTSKRIIAGTRLGDFYKFRNSAAAKASGVYTLTDQKLEFPYVTAEEAWKILGEFFNLTDLGTKVKDMANYILQGRLRYVFRFVQILEEEIRRTTSNLKPTEQLSTEQKEEIFMKALSTHSDAIKMHIDKKWNNIVRRLAAKPFGSTLVNAFYKHIVELLKMSFLGNNPEYNIQDFATKYLASPEDTGFLFFKASDNPAIKETCYLIKEPLVIDILLAKKEIRELMADEQIEQLPYITESTKGFMFEHAFLFSLRAGGYKFFQTLNIPNWCKAIKPTWSEYTFVQKIKSINTAKALLEENQLCMQDFSKLPNNQKQTLIEKMKSDPFLKQHPEIAQGVPSDQLIQKLLAILNMSEEDKKNEMFFFIIKPLDIFIKPSVHLGPDGVGFYEFEGERIACCISSSLYSKPDSDKFNSNKEKLTPNLFYTYWKTIKPDESNMPSNEDIIEKLYNTKKVLVKVRTPHSYRYLLEVPQKVLAISVTIPWSFTPNMIENNYCLVHINQTALANVDPLLTKVFVSKE